MAVYKSKHEFPEEWLEKLQGNRKKTFDWDKIDKFIEYAYNQETGKYNYTQKQMYHCVKDDNEWLEYEQFRNRLQIKKVDFNRNKYE